MSGVVHTTLGQRFPDLASPALRLGLLLVLAAGVSACSQTALVHHDGLPFHVQGAVQHFDGGWIAVDSCASGFHALVEIETPSPPSSPMMPLLLSAVGLGVLEDVAVAGPLCWDTPERWASSRAERAWQQAVASQSERCVYLLRAQYRSKHPPGLTDAIRLADWSRR